MVSSFMEVAMLCCGLVVCKLLFLILIVMPKTIMSVQKCSRSSQILRQ